MNKQEIYEYLKNNEIWHEITEHKPVFNMAEISDVVLPYPDCDAKNLFIRDDKKKNYYLITVKGDKRINLKNFREQNQTRPLSFASENDLMKIMGLIAGAVTPFGVLNDAEHKVQVFFDEDFYKSEKKLIGIHPNSNDATVWLKIDDLVEIIKSHGNIVNIVKIL